MVHLPLSLLRSLHLVPLDLIGEMLLCLPFESMVAFGAACGITDDALWWMLLGDSLFYVWTETMVRDLGPDVGRYVRGVVDAYRCGRDVPLPRRCDSLEELYRTMVLEMTYVRDIDSICSSRGSVVVLATAKQAPHQYGRKRFSTLPFAEWVSFGPRTNDTIGDDVLFGCRTLTTLDLSPLSRVTTVGLAFLTRNGWLRGATFLQKTGAKPVPGASAGGG